MMCAATVDISTDSDSIVVDVVQLRPTCAQRIVNCGVFPSSWVVHEPMITGSIHICPGHDALIVDPINHSSAGRERIVNRRVGAGRRVIDESMESAAVTV